MSVTDHEILRGDRLGTVFPEIHLAALVTPLSSCGLWVWHVTVCTVEDPSGFSGGEGSFLKKKMKQMEEIPERRLTETLLFRELSKGFSFLRTFLNLGKG